VLCGLRGWPRRLALRCEVAPLEESGLRPLCANTQARNTSAIFAACSAWVLGNRAGLLSSGDGTFSSGATLASPSLRASFVLRDGRHSKGEKVSVPFVSRPCCGRHQKLKRRNADQACGQRRRSVRCDDRLDRHRPSVHQTLVEKNIHRDRRTRRCLPAGPVQSRFPVRSRRASPGRNLAVHAS
jgi:hypothetical protein